MKSLEQAIADADTTRGGYNFVEAVKAAARAGYQPEAVPVSASVPAQDNFERVIYPHLNERIILHAASEKELDAKEAAVHASYAAKYAAK
jgi:hypothetical protein